MQSVKGVPAATLRTNLLLVNIVISGYDLLINEMKSETCEKRQNSVHVQYFRQLQQMVEQLKNCLEIE